MNVLGPTSDFPTQGSGKVPGDSPETWLWRIAGFDYRASTRWWNRDTWRAQTKPCVHKDPGKRRRDPQVTEPDLPVSLWVPCGCEGWQQPAEGTKALAGAVLGGTCWHELFWRAPWSLTAKQLTERKQRPTRQQKIGLKVYWARPCPLGQDQVFPESFSWYKPLMLIHQRTERRSKNYNPTASRMKNHNHRKLTKMIACITALCTSVKLWAMLWGPPKMDGSWWSALTELALLEKRVANHFSIFASRTAWATWKCKNI